MNAVLGSAVMCVMVRKECACMCETSLAEIYYKEILTSLNLPFRRKKQWTPEMGISIEISFWKPDTSQRGSVLPRKDFTKF